MNQPDIDVLEDELSTLLSNEASANLLMYRELGGESGESISVSLLDLHVREEVNDTRRNIQQTALLLEQDDLDLPDFTMRPKPKGLVGQLFKLMGNMNIEFDDSPEFSSAYMLHGWVEPTVRALFIKPIRDHFAEDHKWTVCARGRRMVIFQRGKVIEQSQQDSFIKDALEILSLFQMGEEVLDDQPELRRETRADDMMASAERMGGLVGASLARQLKAVQVTQSDLEDFAAQQTPRKVPAGMARQVVGQLKPAIAAALIASLVGTTFGALCLLVGNGYERLIAVPCFMFAGIGLVGTYLLNRYRSRKSRVLRQGALHEGKITEVKRTDTKINDQRRYLVTIQCSQATVVCRAYGTAVTQAQTFKDSGQSVRVLIDPADANHAVCLDLLAITSG